MKSLTEVVRELNARPISLKIAGREIPPSSAHNAHGRAANCAICQAPVHDFALAALVRAVAEILGVEALEANLDRARTFIAVHGGDLVATGRCSMSQVRTAYGAAPAAPGSGPRARIAKAHAALAVTREAMAELRVEVPYAPPGEGPSAADNCRQIFEMLDHGLNQLALYIGREGLR